jgi:hypothetical protein
MKKFIRISHPIEGLIRFKLYPFQEDLIRMYEAHRLIIIVKGRQLGISTLTSAYILWFLMFHAEKTVLSIATKEKVAAEIVKRARRMYAMLPDWFHELKHKDGDPLFKFDRDSTSAFKFEKNGSQAVASATSPDAGRSFAVSLLIIDEAAHVDRMDETWKALSPTISTGGRCIAFSSPNGQHNWFYKMYEQAEKGRNGFHPVKLPWNVHPDRDDEWFETEKQKFNHDLKALAQEHEADFLATGRTVVDPQDLQRILDGTKEPDRKTWMDQGYWIWKNPDPNHKYLLAADVATGDGEDDSAFHIIDLNTVEQVAEYKGKLPYEMFADFIESCAKEYNTAHVIVENNNIGTAVAQLLEKHGYPNLIYTVRGSGQLLERYDGEYRKDAVPGFSTHYKSRPLLVNKMEQCCRLDVIKINSIRLHKELTGFIWKDNGKPEGSSDDLTLAFAFACWVREAMFVEDASRAGHAKSMLGAMGVAKKNVTDFSANRVTINPSNMNLTMRPRTTAMQAEQNRRKQDIYRQHGPSAKKSYGADFIRKYGALLKD